MFVFVQRCATILIIIALILLFIFPQRFVNQSCRDMICLIDYALDYLQAGDIHSASVVCSQLVALYRLDAPRLKRFINHSAINAIGLCLEPALRLAELEDRIACSEKLSEAKQAIMHISEIERFEWNTLL